MERQTLARRLYWVPAKPCNGAFVDIAAITFDLDDTLWPIAPTIREAERELHAWFARHAPKIARQFSLEDLGRLREEIGRERRDIAHDLSALRLASLERAARMAGEPPQVARQAFQVFYAARNRVRFYPDVGTALPALAASRPLAALTNGNACLRRTGADRWLNFSISAREVGAPKPDAAMFDAAAHRLGLAPERILHVGDDPEHDGRGARAAGYQSVLIDRDRRFGAELDGIPVIRHLEELTARLAVD